MGLRERKKEKTRLALLDTALTLFLEQGYESTTVEQIAGSVDVSPRTFFRYFTSKDHLLLWYHDQSEETMLESLAARPPGEPPFVSMTHAMRAMLRDMEEATPEDAERFFKIRRILDDNPSLAHHAFARALETEQRLVRAVAARSGLDPDGSPLPHLAVTFAMAAVRIGFSCRATSLEETVSRVEQTLRLAEDSLRPGWDTPPPGSV